MLKGQSIDCVTNLLFGGTLWELEDFDIFDVDSYRRLKVKISVSADHSLIFILFLFVSFESPDFIEV